MLEASTGADGLMLGSPQAQLPLSANAADRAMSIIHYGRLLHHC
jgi:hypothetical protein